MTKKILVTFSIAFVGALLGGCSGSASEGSALTTSELSKTGGGKGESTKGDGTGDAEKGDPGTDAPSDDGKTGEADKGEPGKDDPSDVPEKDPGKEDPSGDSCFAEVLKDGSCQSDETWKAMAQKLCSAKGLSVSALSTSDDCKGGSTVAKVSCCK